MDTKLGFDRKDAYKVNELFSELDKQSNNLHRFIKKFDKYIKYKEFFVYVNRIKTAYDKYSKAVDDLDKFMQDH